MASSPSASAPFRHAKHEVFLSFRGEDTRHNFLYHLYEAFRRKGIGAYADFNELPRGEEISHSLLKAIEESMISTIVFSQNYATSSWCLEELSKIMECRHSRGQLVVPIFYHVNPHDIRKQTGCFEKTCLDHERNRIDKVQRWRHALIEAGNLSGWSLTGDKPESEVIEDIVHDIVNKLNRLSKSDYKGLIGIGHHMEQIKSLLCIGGEDVRIIGIWGMGGIGKTTLAQAIYDEVSAQFESCYFLANVREEIERHGAIALRDKLLSKLLNEENLHIGTPMIGSTFIKERLCRKRVLVVFDDVNDLEQLEILAISHNHFGLGSRIIVTSRDKQVLVNGSVDGIYEVKELSYNDSLKLFSLFAFKQNHLVDDFKDLSNSFLKYANGVPLALKVLGSTVYQQSIAYWESILNRLKQYPNPKIQNVLKISFEGLDELEKNIFLDIACFFKGYDRDYVIKILDNCYCCTVHCGITNLIDKCLLNVTKEKKLGMHDLLQEMGRNVVRAESQNPEEHTRLWTPTDVCRVLKNGRGTKSIQGILLDQSQIDEAQLIQLHPRAFARMHNLRIIKFYGKGGKWVLLHRGLISLPNELRYFQWEYCILKSLPSNFSPENLVELRLPNSKVKQLWNGDQNLVNLRVLDLSYCGNLTRIPNLSAAINIETLLIDGCKSLVELPSMIHLKSLYHDLHVVHCNNLKKFPELPQHIKRLTLHYTAIEEIPESIGYLHQLVHLNLIQSRVKAVSKNICMLESLESLYLEVCPIVLFPEVPRNLKSLDLSSSRIHNLPSTIVQLDALKEIFLCDCLNISKFPNVPESIKRLFLDKTSIEEVPSSISRLKSLACLSMRGCRKLKSLPPSICELKSVEELDLVGCSNLDYFPEILKTMECLYHLDLSGTTIEEVPSSISKLKSLAYLSMRGCRKLKSLPPSICDLKSLEELDLEGCSNLKYFPEILKTMECLYHLNLSRTAIEEVPSSISRLKSLACLSMRGCAKLKSLPTSICKLKSLARLYLNGCSNLEYFPEILRTMKCLTYLDLSGTAIKVLLPSNIFGLGESRNLSVPSSFCNLVFLQKLHLSGSNIVEIPESIKQLSNLIFLRLRSCKSLKSLAEPPPHLRFLDAQGCTSLERVSKWEQFQYRKVARIAIGTWFLFNNCFNLDPEAVNNILANAHLRIQCMAKEFLVESYKGAHKTYANGIFFCLPGSEISETFKNRSSNSSITVKLSPAHSNKRFLGFVLCIVVDFEHHHDCRAFRVECKYRLKTKCGDHHNFAYRWCWPYKLGYHICFESSHVILLFDGFESGIIEASRNKHFDEASLEFYVELNKEQMKVQKCGVTAFYVDALRSNFKEVESNMNYRSDDEEAVDSTNETLEPSCHANSSLTQDEESRCDVKNRDLEGSMMEEDANDEEGLDDSTTMKPRLKRSFSYDEKEQPYLGSKLKKY